jgi:hypothetical protein
MMRLESAVQASSGTPGKWLVQRLDGDHSPLSTDSLNCHVLLPFGIGTGLNRQHLSHVHRSLHPLINKDHDSGRMQGLAAQEQHVTEPGGPAVEMEGVADGEPLCSAIITIPA